MTLKLTDSGTLKWQEPLSVTADSVVEITGSLFHEAGGDLDVTIGLVYVDVQGDFISYASEVVTVSGTSETDLTTYSKTFDSAHPAGAVRAHLTLTKDHELTVFLAYLGFRDVTSETEASNYANTAYTAQVAAENAQSLAETARDSAEAAETAADAALALTETSQSLAEAAQTAAEAAETESAAAQALAETAQTAAETAYSSALTAQSNAEDAEANSAASAVTATSQAANALSSATQSASSATDAAGSEAAALTSETNAANSETASGNSASAAATSASTATTKASEASTSAGVANTAKLAAETAQGSAESAATSAATSESNAQGSANSAATSETNAATSENAAGDSATAATNSAATAATKATEASTSASASESSRLGAETAQGNAETAETNAAASETNAAGSEASSATSATNAATSENNAGSSATAAAGSASTASTKATDAATSATAANAERLAAETAQAGAETAETNAATSETNATGSAASAASSATNAANSETASGISAGAAATSASSAASEATDAGTSASAAETAQLLAESAESAASSSETSAALSETNAAGSEAASATSATNAANSENAAGDSADAAATSASTATTKAGEASTSAAAADADRIAAQTAESNASASETAAATSETNAAGSASAASTSETNAASSETAAGSSATSAASSASVATTKAGEASTSAASANTSKLAAETAKSSAETAETNAATSETNAAGSASSASTSATNAASSETASGSSATAAAASASTATSEADDAASSASAAETAQLNAESAESGASSSETAAATSETNAAGSEAASATSATNAAASETAAGNFASSASSSASTATTKASEASTSAAAASTAKVAAETAETNAGVYESSAASSLESVEQIRDQVEITDFRDGARHWANGYGYSKAVQATRQTVVQAFPDASIVNDAAEGEVLEVNGSYRVFSERQARPFIDGQRFRAKVKTRLTVDNASHPHRHMLWLAGFEGQNGALYSNTGAISFVNLTVADGWVIREWEFVPTDIRPLMTNGFEDATEWYLMVGANGWSQDPVGGAVQQFAWISIEDISSEYAASQSASAAQTAKVAAETAESNAAASESASANSATNAAGSEAASATSATNAANSETNAGNSASAASSSASVATTKASEASTSATAAQTAKTAAETAEANASVSETSAATSVTQTQDILEDTIKVKGNFDFDDGTVGWSRDSVNFLSDIQGSVSNGVYTIAGSEEQYCSTLIPVDTSRHYRMKIRVRARGAASSRTYSGVATYDENKVRIITPSPGTHRYGVLANYYVPNDNTWYEYEAVFTGEEATTDSFRPGTKYISMLCLSNYAQSATDGIFDIDYITFEDITESVLAGQSASAAQVSQTAADTSRANAETAEANAATSETNAASSASSASSSASTATAAKNDAETAQTGAETAETNASASETSAANSASNAAGSASSAGSSASTATAAKNAAETAETNAETSETNAATSASNASGSASSASTSASNAASSETVAGDSASSASSSASIATTKANEAYTSAAAATSAKTAAETALTDAVIAKNAAVEAYDDAEEARSQAVDAQLLAVGAKNDASGYANAALGHKNTAETKADDAALSAQASLDEKLLAVAAKNTAVDAKNDAVDAHGLAVIAQGHAVDAFNDAITARDAASSYATVAAHSEFIATTAAKGNLFPTPLADTSIGTSGSSGGSSPAVVTHGQSEPASTTALRTTGDASEFGMYGPRIDGIGLSDRKYRLTAKMRASVVLGIKVQMSWFNSIGGHYTNQGWSDTVNVGTSYGDAEFLFEIGSIDAVEIRVRFLTPDSGASGRWFEYTDVFWEDVTESTLAKNQATAAYTSEQNAGTEAFNAGQSAFASDQSKLAAISAKGDAEAAEGRIVTLEENADGFASAAALSAATAAESLVNASGYTNGNYVGRSIFEDGELGHFTSSTVVDVPAAHPLGRTKCVKLATRDLYFKRDPELADTAGGAFPGSLHERTLRIRGYCYCSGDVDARAGIRSLNTDGSSSTWPTIVAAGASTNTWVQYDGEITVSDADGAWFFPFFQNNGFPADDTLESYWTDMEVRDVTDDKARRAETSFNQTSIAGIEGDLAAAITMRVKAGTSNAELELVAADDTAGSVSAARISADDIVLNGSVTANHIAAGSISAGLINTSTLGAISAKLGAVQITESLTMDQPTASFVAGKTSAKDLHRTGYYLGRTANGDKLATELVEGNTYTIKSLGTTDFTLNGADSNTVETAFIANATVGTGTGVVTEVGFEISVGSQPNGVTSAIHADEASGVNLINPRIWIGTPTEGTLSTYASSGTSLIGPVDSLDVVAIGGGQGGGRGSQLSGHTSSEVGGDGGNTTVQIYDGDPTGTGTLEYTITATGGTGKGRSMVDEYYNSSGGDGDKTIAGLGGLGGGFQQHGNSPLVSALGAGGGGGGVADYQQFFGNYYRGDGGEGGAAGEVISQTVDTSAFSNPVYITLTCGSAGTGVYNGSGSVEVGGSGGDGAAGGAMVGSAYAGLVEHSFNANNIPSHQWSGTQLRFTNPDESWGAFSNLEGTTGAQGKSVHQLATGTPATGLGNDDDTAFAADTGNFYLKSAGSWNLIGNLTGPQGIQGITGDTGDEPAHQWSGTQIRFQNPNASWGGYVDLEGAQGVKGDTGDKGDPGDLSAGGTISGDVTLNGVLTLTAPAAPSVTGTSVVGETIEVVFSQSATTDIDKYEVWSNSGGSSFGLIAIVASDDFLTSMSVIDSSFDVSGSIQYRVYAVKNGVYSTAATTTKAFSQPTLDVVNMAVRTDVSHYHIGYDLPDSRFLDHIEIYRHAHSTAGSLARGSASLVYSGERTSFTYPINSPDLDKFHQFWVECVES